ncbi:MAG: acetyl-CoA carboxylase carboxyl transferase subunit alpha [Flavobacteriales bacterium]|nr:acetyl-CoA carboxylase carboxyl transferase subunit alpha [Flavobacteriales bacterium]|tara:strand:+ start:1130 stop:2083 length:954 start_codon:yes stop_codon:yes gene_type:complete
MEYLDFEKPIEELIEKLNQTLQLGNEGKIDVSSTVTDLEKKIKNTRKEIYKNLTPWQKVQMSRHPQRPYTLDYINQITKGDFIELHGDRAVKDDKAMVGGWGTIDGETVMFIGQQKGRNTKDRQYRNFGMSNPEGYRKALRLMKMAEKFGKPVVTLIDTPGAFPGLEAEERGQGEAIAHNLIAMSKLKVPIICVIIGEGASGGALGIGIGDKVLMMENSWYSVISPENCSTILWRSWEFKEKAASALKLTSDDMMKNKLIDGVIKEPIGGAHTFPEQAYKNVKQSIKESIKECKSLKVTKLVKNRMEKFSNMGIYSE